ncbi:MAG: hypothetical protein P8180_17315 [Gammaproteobacteria bacterium]
MTGWRRLAKGLTPALLTLWVAFVVLSTVQPCCEAVADTFMAGGPVSSMGHRHEVMEEAHQHMVGGSEPVHTHCGQILHRRHCGRAPSPGAGRSDSRSTRSGRR